MIWRVQAAQEGRGKFSVVMRARNGTDTIETLPAISEAVEITPLGYGEGERVLGGMNAATDLSGEALFQFPLPEGITSGTFITATATDPDGNTSEFSQALLIQGAVSTFPKKGISDSIQQQVPGGKARAQTATASLNPPGPQLSIVSAKTGTAQSLSLDTVTQQLKTNLVPVVTSVLTWPATATNWTLYFKDDLTASIPISTNNPTAPPDSFWQPASELAVIVNGRNIVTNSAINPSRFYRLAPPSGSAGLTAE